MKKDDRRYTGADIVGDFRDCFGISEGVFFKDGLYLGYDVRYTPSFFGLCSSKRYFVEQVFITGTGLLERKLPTGTYEEGFKNLVYERKGSWFFDESTYTKVR